MIPIRPRWASYRVWKVSAEDSHSHLYQKVRMVELLMLVAQGDRGTQALRDIVKAIFWHVATQGHFHSL